MNYLILAETEFFAMINEADSGCLKTAYGGFISSVISLCHECADRNQAAITLAYTENELQYHNTLYTAAGKSMTDLYVRKALAFVRKMQKVPCSSPSATNSHPTSIPPLSHSKKKQKKHRKSLQWTGNTLRPCGAGLRAERDGLYRQRRDSLEGARPCPLRVLRTRHQGVLPLLLRHQNCARIPAAPISSTRCRRNSMRRFDGMRNWSG